MSRLAQSLSSLHDPRTGDDAVTDGWSDEVDLELRRQYSGIG